MYNVLVATLLSSTTLGLAADVDKSATAELKWSRHYDRARKAAQEAHRPLLVVIENPAKSEERLEDRELTPGRAGAQLLTKYQLCRVDVSTEYGQRVADAFGARQLPYTAITDKSSKFIVFQKGGRMSPVEWHNTLVRNAKSTTSRDSTTGYTATLPSTTVNFGTGSIGPIYYYPSPSGTCANCRRR